MNNKPTKVDVINYEPPLRLKNFVSKLFETGSKTEAERVTKYDRRSFYKILKTSERFKQWYDDEVEVFSQGLILRALKTLDEVMEKGENESAKIAAVRMTLELLGKIRINNSINVDNKTVNLTFLDLAKKARYEKE